MENPIVTSTKDKIRRITCNKRDANDFNAEYQHLRSMNFIQNHHDGNNSCTAVTTTGCVADTIDAAVDNIDGSSSCCSNDSLNTISDEIPVWVNGEQRWISGINEDTTCADLVSVLLADEGITITTTVTSPQQQQQQQQQQQHLATTITRNKNHLKSTEQRGFVITERWRRVEQILNDDTKILQIWSAWGDAKSEVKLTLRQIDPNLSTADWFGAATATESYTNSNDKDSGMGSPNGSSNSAIIRRKKHRASKSTPAWITQANTLHPKSNPKSSIEKLMKLILEQGETIQQQLAKLRDRELQINRIEEERHKNREKEHGKNYLLETYLNGLPEIEIKETVAVNSDSGVQTEGGATTSSPAISCSFNQNEEDDHDYAIKSTFLSEEPTWLQESKEVKKEAQQQQQQQLATNNSKRTKITFKGNYNTLANHDDNDDNDVDEGAVGFCAFKEKTSHREKKLLKDHMQAKEFSSFLLQQQQQHEQELEQQQHNDTVNKKGKLTATKFSPKLSSSPLPASQQQKPTMNLKKLKKNFLKKFGKISSPLAGAAAAATSSSSNSDDSTDDDDDNEENIAEKIKWMEKLVTINKHLQREEELLVRLGVKIRKYETENPQLNETQIREALIKVNNEIEASGAEMKKLETDIELSNAELQEKSTILENLSKELQISKNVGSCRVIVHQDHNGNKLPESINDNTMAAISVETNLTTTAVAVTTPNPSVITTTNEMTSSEMSTNVNSDQMGNSLNLNCENLVENLYNFSQFIAKPNYDFNIKNENLNRDQQKPHQIPIIASASALLPSTSLATNEIITVPVASTTATTTLSSNASAIPLIIGAEMKIQQNSQQHTNTITTTASNTTNKITKGILTNKTSSIAARNKTNNFALLQNYYPPPPQGFEENYPDIIATANSHQFEKQQQYHPKNLLAKAPIMTVIPPPLPSTSSLPMMNCNDINRILKLQRIQQTNDNDNTIGACGIDLIPSSMHKNNNDYLNLMTTQQSTAPAAAAAAGTTPAINFFQKSSNTLNNNPNNINIFNINNNNSIYSTITNNRNYQQKHIAPQSPAQNNFDMNIYKTSTANRIVDGNSYNSAINSIGKFGPKRLLINNNHGGGGGSGSVVSGNGDIGRVTVSNEIESNSDTGLSSLGEDALHLGTLV